MLKIQNNSTLAVCLNVLVIKILNIRIYFEFRISDLETISRKLCCLNLSFIRALSQVLLDVHADNL